MLTIVSCIGILAMNYFGYQFIIFTLQKNYFDSKVSLTIFFDYSLKKLIYFVLYSLFTGILIYKCVHALCLILKRGFSLENESLYLEKEFELNREELSIKDE
ncbi:hypothetical protein IW492_07655 [Enterococcus sp. BWB1-3]|uniref:hypothetical protein n=1 Tax=unclassified Enterococcus TaxID=2608891 RepID=UPI001924DDAF|nr:MULTISPECIES: hypothetical protein [unclassified Enterococcus]MBL1229108.1 hypothetical protein [Enterococcus sp. BWB1-3]MCB5952482.1 hypothetical protein [Enterococcus sp. BWT-B8]